VGDDQRPTEGDSRLRGTREPRLSSFACIHTLPVLGTSLFVYCLFILFTNPHPESDTISQEKHKYKTAVWIKWPTQGALKTQVLENASTEKASTKQRISQGWKTQVRKTQVRICMDGKRKYGKCKYNANLQSDKKGLVLHKF